MRPEKGKGRARVLHINLLMQFIYHLRAVQQIPGEVLLENGISDNREVVSVQSSSESEDLIIEPAMKDKKEKEGKKELNPDVSVFIPGEPYVSAEQHSAGKDTGKDLE